MKITRRRDWSKIGEIAEKNQGIRAQLQGGCETIEPALLYEHNKRRKRDGREVTLEVSDKKESGETGDSGASTRAEESPVALPEDVAQG